jgi:hypothetical protein
MTYLQAANELAQIEDEIRRLDYWEGDDIDHDVRSLQRRASELRALLASAPTSTKGANDGAA